MATVRIDKFGGIAPRQHPTQLADGMATVAMNVKLESGKLVPLRQPRLVTQAPMLLQGGLGDPGDAQSMHIWRRADGSFDFLLFPGVTWAAPGNVADDELTRLVVSGKRGESAEAPVVYMRTTGGMVAHPIIKEPPAAPLVARDPNAADLDTGIVRYTRFVYTWVDEYGMESPPSMPSQILEATYRGSDGWTFDDSGEDVVVASKSGETDITVPDDALHVRRSEGVVTEIMTTIDEDLAYLDGDTVLFEPPVLPSGAEAVAIRIYKVLTGSEAGYLQFWEEKSVEAAETGFQVAKRDADAGESMPEITAPPDDLRCILAVPGAFYCGFSPSKPKTVCFSDVDLLYSWPEQYRYDIEDNIVALAVTSNSVYALTDGWPYVLSGTAPESMTVAKLATPAACVSARSVCVFKNAVFYASNAGLMAIANSATEGTLVQNVTEAMFTRDQWQALNPSSCLAGHHDGRLFLYFTPADGTRRGFTVNFSDGLSVALTEHDEVAKCLCVDNREDKMYFIREEEA